MNVDEFAELSAGHALGALSPEDERAYSLALVEHPEWTSLAETDAATAAELADGVVRVEPPAHLRAAILAGIGTLPERQQEPSTAEPDPPQNPAPTTEAVQTAARRNWTRGLLALAASFVLLLALGATAVILGDRLHTPASTAALEQIEAAADAESATATVAGGGTATAHWSATLGKAVLVTDGVDAASAHETYELWFVRDGTPVSAGQFDTDRSGEATAELEGAMQAGDTIAVTVEPEGGSPTGQPTSDPIVAIPTA